MIVARSPVCRDRRRCSTWSSPMPAPAAARALNGSTGTGWPGTARPALSSPCPGWPAGLSIIQTRATSGAAVSVSAAVCRWMGVSTNSARAPESARIHSTCSGEDVS